MALWKIGICMMIVGFFGLASTGCKTSTPYQSAPPPVFIGPPPGALNPQTTEPPPASFGTPQPYVAPQPNQPAPAKTSAPKISYPANPVTPVYGFEGIEKPKKRRPDLET